MNFFDLHCDTPYKCYSKNLSFDDDSLSVSANGMDCFEKWHQCFAVWISEDIRNPFEYYKNVLNNFKMFVKPLKNDFVPIFTIEGGTLIQNDLSRIEVLKSDGIRVLTLTWNGENQIASGVNALGGLKSFGKQVINALNEKRIAVDLSHLNRESFFNAIEHSKYPIATHSCCDNVFSHKRNLTDEQIRLLVKRGGIVGLCLYPAFLGEGDVFYNVYKHIYHLLDMGFEDSIAIGSDFDGADMDVTLNKITDIPLLYEKICELGIKEKILNKIFFHNANNFFLKL